VPNQEESGDTRAFSGVAAGKGSVGGWDPFPSDGRGLGDVSEVRLGGLESLQSAAGWDRVARTRASRSSLPADRLLAGLTPRYNTEIPGLLRRCASERLGVAAQPGDLEGGRE
jgi:hypothetical protein